jgi:uncharacterized DUF497 family protein
MEITYDHSKNRRNLIERNLSFDDVAEFDLKAQDSPLMNEGTIERSEYEQ